jgi:hypothetical protein
MGAINFNRIVNIPEVVSLFNRELGPYFNSTTTTFIESREKNQCPFPILFTFRIEFKF